MFQRWVSVGILIAIGVLPVTSDVFAASTTPIVRQPQQFITIRKPTIRTLPRINVKTSSRLFSIKINAPASRITADTSVIQYFVTVRTPAMSVVERFKEKNFTRRPPVKIHGSVPHVAADVPAPALLALAVPPQPSSEAHPQTAVSHAPAIPSAHRIRAP